MFGLFSMEKNDGKKGCKKRLRVSKSLRVRCLYFCCASLDSQGFVGSSFSPLKNPGILQVTSQIRGIIDGTITDFEDFDQKLALKERAKQIRQAPDLDGS